MIQEQPPTLPSVEEVRRASKELGISDWTTKDKTQVRFEEAKEKGKRKGKILSIVPPKKAQNSVIKLWPYQMIRKWYLGAGL
jgi:hypothetical protein